MKYNYHTHTAKCRHASGTEREYIENAIAAGIKVLGFSDHVPYPFDGDYYSGFRMFVDQTEEYAMTLAALRDEYKGQIDIKIGYEAEYYPMFFEKLLRLITQYPCDYLILGQHYIENEMTGKYSGSETEEESYLKGYVDEVSEAMRTGLYTYVAHPDLLNFRGDSKVYDREYSRLIECAVDCGVPLEINLLGIRGGRHYPNNRFFELCGKLGAAVCIGSDAHSPDTVYDGDSYKKALDICEMYQLKLIENPTLRPVK